MPSDFVFLQEVFRVLQNNLLDDIQLRGFYSLILKQPNRVKAIVNSPDSVEAHKELAQGHASGKPELKLSNDHIKAILNNRNSIEAHKLLRGS